MKKITREAVRIEHNKETRKTYFQGGEGRQVYRGLETKKDRPTFSARVESVRKIFEVQTGIKLGCESKHQGYYRYVDEEEIVKIRDWMQDQRTLVYLQDCLSISVALTINHTQTSALAYNCKKQQDKKLIDELVSMVEQQIGNLPYYKDADLICSVPSPPNKGFDLPGRVASLVGGKIGKQNITKGFVFSGEKLSIKGLPFNGKWQAWEDARISFQSGDEFNVNDKTVILIDDLYQSGITIQYIAMKLQQAGAREVYGLSFIKTIRDTDNVS